LSKNVLYSFGDTHLNSKRARMSQVVYVKEASTLLNGEPGTDCHQIEN